MAGVLEPTATYPWGLFKMDLCVHPNMRNRAIAMIFIFLIALIPPVDAAEAEHLQTVGAVFGGVHVLANSNGNASSMLSALPAIVEDYTATWCENCVDVEQECQQNSEPFLDDPRLFTTLITCKIFDSS